MTDPLRSDRSSTPGDAAERERDARIEALLLSGLDHYFAGRHERAINVWTRVWFLDRGHARARAYIERARGAVAERQREGEELLHTGAAALHRGDRTSARQLLTSAVERGASDEEALALLHQLDRMEAAGHHRRPAVTPHRAHREIEGAVAVAPPRRDPRVIWGAAGILAGLLMASTIAGYLWIVADPFGMPAPQHALPTAAVPPLPVPTVSEIRLARARDLFSRGRAHDALALLEDGVASGRRDPANEAFRARVQRYLLESGRRAASPASSSPSTRSSLPAGSPR